MSFSLADGASNVVLAVFDLRGTCVRTLYAGRAAAGAANVEEQASYDARNPQALKRLLSHGVQLRPFSQAVMEACLKASNEVNAEESAKNPNYKKVLESMEAFRNDEYLWWQVAEYGFDSFMIRTRSRG